MATREVLQQRLNKLERLMPDLVRKYPDRDDLMGELCGHADHITNDASAANYEWANDASDRLLTHYGFRRRKTNCRWVADVCGRYAMFGPVSTSHAAKAALEQMDVDLEGALNLREPQYNFAPTQKSPILAHTDDGCTIKDTRWG